MEYPKLAKDIMVTKLDTLSPDKDVFKAMGLLLKKRISGTPVVDQDRNFLGVFSEKCCLKVLHTAVQLAFNGEQTNRKSTLANKLSRDVMVTKLVTLKPHSDVFESIGYLLNHRISGAPVVDDEGGFLGVFSERYCMSLLIKSAYEQLPTAEVGSFMNTDFGRTISEDVDLLNIAQMFINTEYRRLPVLRDGKLIGQISRRDVIRAAYKSSTIHKERNAALLCLRELQDSGEVPVENTVDPLSVRAFMDSNARTITEETDLLGIAQIFLSTNYRRLPVLRDGKLVGQISRRDLLRAVHELLAAPRERERSTLYLSSLIELREAPIG